MTIAVDLDGTLAVYNGWISAEHIGAPVPEMKQKVMKWLEEGVEVVIFTARAETDYETGIVHTWLKRNGFPELEVTNIKRKSFQEIYDDRAYRVLRNRGIVL